MVSLEPLLPEYGKPPVEEVAVSITFDAIDGLTSAQVGRLWQRYPSFPRTEDHPELELAVEEPAIAAPPRAPRVEFTPVPRVRTWFLSADGTRLIQIQQNRFAYNWRRGDSNAAYPSYGVVRKEFSDALALFRDFLKDSGLGEIKPLQSEITYVNHIKSEKGWPHSRVADVMRTWRDLPNGFLPAPEDVRFLARYTIPGRDGSFLGRLAASLTPAYLRDTGTEVLILNMLARGKPLEPSMEGALSFLDIGHEWIVRGFTEMTTEEMHKRWERQR